METLLYIVHVIVCIGMLPIILLQSGKGGGVSAVFGGGGAGTVFGSRGASNFLTRMTTGFAIVFMCTSFGLSYMSSRQRSVVADIQARPPAGAMGTEAAADQATPPAAADEAGQATPPAAADEAGQVDAVRQRLTRRDKRRRRHRPDKRHRRPLRTPKRWVVAPAIGRRRPAPMIRAPKGSNAAVFCLTRPRSAHYIDAPT